MNNKNLNCHPEDIEGSQPLHISTRNIAENTKLNREIAEQLKKHISLSCQCSTLGRSKKQPMLFFARRRNETCCCETAEAVETTAKSELSRSNKDSLATWILRSSRSMTMIFCLTIFMLFPTLAKAEQCTPTPDCASLGYTETSCPDGGGVKCPWNTSLMYCPQCQQKDPCQSCYVGWILNSDMTCSTEKENGKTPIGIVANQTVTANECKGFAVTLNNLDGQTKWENANYQSNNYNINGINNWHLPSQEELLNIHNNIEKIQSSLLKLGGTTFIDDYYWSSSAHDHGYWYVNPISGKVFGINYDNIIIQVRPILTF